jgi:hypothetical protein
MKDGTPKAGDLVVGAGPEAKWDYQAIIRQRQHKKVDIIRA